MCRLTTILLLCTAHAASAFECNLTFANTQISVASKELCEYTNYHLFMLGVFGILAFSCMLYTCLLVLCRDAPETVRSSARLSFIFFVFSLGFETPIVITVFALLMVSLYGALVDCAQWLPCFRVQIHFSRRVVPLNEIVVDPPSAPPQEVRVEPQQAAREIVIDTLQVDLLRNALIEAIQQALRQNDPSMNFVLETTQQTGPRGGVVIETTQQATPPLNIVEIECPICLNTGDSDELGWALTRCRHTFHTACLRGWTENHNTCPKCRACLGYAGRS
jgi:hypothetical protein